MLQHLHEPAVDRLADRRRRPRVLNATNGSAASQCATAAAAVIAHELDAELIVVHVRPPETMRVGRLAPTIVHTIRLEDPHGNKVLSAARQLAWTNGTFARLILMTGDPAPAIASLADQLSVDLIVIGARQSGVPAVLSARTRSHIQRVAPCPVRVVTLPVGDPACESLKAVPAA